MKTPHLVYSLPYGHVMPEHEIGEHTGRTAGHSHLAVHQHLPTRGQGTVDEVGNFLKMLGNIRLVHIYQFQTLVFNASWLVVCLGV